MAIKLLWDSEKEFYEMHSKDIFGNFNFYESTIYGRNDEEFLNLILKDLQLNKNSVLIDYGCGSGYLAEAASRICKHATGISTSQECINICRERRGENKKLSFVVAGMENYKQQELATHIVAMESLGYACIKSTLENANRSLIAGGNVYIREVIRLANENDKQKYNRKYIEDYFFYETRTLESILKEAKLYGFEVAKVDDYTQSQNEKNFIETLRYNKVPFTLPFPEEEIFVEKKHITLKKIKDL